MLAGGFGVFIIGPVLDKWGIAWGFFVTFMTGTLWGVLQFVPSIPAQGLSWATFALYRAFFFSVVASYMVAVFGYSNMGKVYGFCNVASATFSIFNNQARTPLLLQCTNTYLTPQLGSGAGVCPGWGVVQGSERRVPWDSAAAVLVREVQRTF